MQYGILFMFLSTVTSFSYLPEVEIDLSATPKQRWKQAVRTILDLHGYENSFGPVFEFHNKTTFYILNTDDYSTIANAIRTHYPEYSSELDGIVEELNRSEITFEYLSAWAYFHEISHISGEMIESTGVLLSVGDQIIHGRNMEQAPAQARNMVLHLIIKKDDKYLGESVDWQWFKVGFSIIRFQLNQLINHEHTIPYLNTMLHPLIKIGNLVIPSVKISSLLSFNQEYTWNLIIMLYPLQLGNIGMCQLMII